MKNIPPVYHYNNTNKSIGWMEFFSQYFFKNINDTHKDEVVSKNDGLQTTTSLIKKSSSDSKFMVVDTVYNQSNKEEEGEEENETV